MGNKGVHTFPKGKWSESDLNSANLIVRTRLLQCRISHDAAGIPLTGIKDRRPNIEASNCKTWKEIKRDLRSQILKNFD